MKNHQFKLFLLLPSLVTTCAGSIIVDDFSTSITPINITDVFPDTNFVTSLREAAPGTLFENRYAYVYLDEGPGSISANISSGFLTITTTETATGRFYLYHDSFFSGPYRDFSPYFASGGVFFSFAAPIEGSPELLLALQSPTGRIIGNFTITDGITQFFAPFAAFSTIDVFTPTEVFESRYFFSDIGPNSTVVIDEIAIIPEPSSLYHIAFLVFSLTFIIKRKD